MSESIPMVSVFMLAYKHENFIKAAIDSVLSQKVDFDYEIVIGEDCSPDNTRNILLEYKALYPEKFNLILHKENVGAIRNQNITLGECRGKYIAILEGDDYWVDEYKLQKQVSFLEQNPTFSMCFTDVIIKDEKNKGDVKFYPEVPSDVLTFADIVAKHYIPTCTVLIKNLFPKPLPDFFYHARSGDIAIEIFIAENGPVKYFPEKTAVNRVHIGGITSNPIQQAQGGRSYFRLINSLNEYFEYRHESVFKEKLAAIAKGNLINASGRLKGWKKIQNVAYWFPRYIKTQPKFSLREVIRINLLLFFPFMLKGYQKIKA